MNTIMKNISVKNKELKIWRLSREKWDFVLGRDLGLHLVDLLVEVVQVFGLQTVGPVVKI